MEPKPDVGRILIDRDTSRPWVEVAQGSRINQDLLRETPPAETGSPLDIVDDYFPMEPIERWCRSYLSAALEHLVMWADFAAPTVFHPDAVVHHSQRPAQTLARAALESASQAVWVLAADTPLEMARRHVTLVLHDWEEQRKAAIDPATKAALKQKALDVYALLQRGESDFRPPTYLTLVTSAAAEVRTQLSSVELAEPDQVERLWRASAGSAHGKMWPAIELTVTMTIDDKPYTFPDPTAITSILVLAEAVTSYGVFRFIDRAGHEPDLARRLRETAERWYAKVPKLPGAPERLPDQHVPPGGIH